MGEQRFLLKNISFEKLTENIISANTAVRYFFDSGVLRNVRVVNLELNQGMFTIFGGAIDSPQVLVVQNNGDLLVSCTCNDSNANLCEHRAIVLNAILKRDEFAVFFKTSLRHEKLKKFASGFGLQDEPNPDDYFSIVYQNSKVDILPKINNLVAVTAESLDSMREELIPKEPELEVRNSALAPDEKICILFRRHKFNRYLLVELYKAPMSKDGRVKNPLTPVRTEDFIWEISDPEPLKFFSAINRFQNNRSEEISEQDINALRIILRNPLEYEFFYHDHEISENVNASTLIPAKTAILKDGFEINVKKNNQFFEIDGSIQINGKQIAVEDIQIRFGCFIQAVNTLYLVNKLQVLGVLNFLKKNHGSIKVHESKFKEFRAQLLKPLEDKVNVSYKHIKTVNENQLAKHGLIREFEKIIYLSDFGQHVMIIPVMRYGEVEIPVLTKRQMYTFDSEMKEFRVKRNHELENELLSLILKQHSDFEEQLEYELHYLYLHKRHFLDENWFLPTFEEWRQHNITVLGFNSIKDNKLNPDKISVDIKVLSGINWFNAQVQVKFGRKKASLKQLHKALLNRSKYVQLDDGTLGILPNEWIEKFAQYFSAGDIADDEHIHIPRINFSTVADVYNDNELDEEVKRDIKKYHDKLSSFEAIEDIKHPDGLTATLRPYQKQGLNWLNFLDDFNFGGCLADDMGLGKSIQIIAFILSQRNKTLQNTNLLVVPTTLIFNWKKEIEKFAPSLKVFTIYGPDRIKKIEELNKYEVVLTSYGTLLSDVSFLKDYYFNYIFLDESQNIRNPDTQRYKSVRVLNSRNKIVITGTPLENNTFDIYGQLSFACPGLLGNKRYFRDVYSIPIDKFKSSKRAAELQNKIKPFILRRTKEQVAPELPDKTEIVLYCEMKEEQQKTYQVYEKEFREYISATTGEELSKRSMSVLKGLTRLRQICDSPKLLGSEMRATENSSKIEMLMEQIESKAANHKMLVFSQFVSMLDLIKDELLKRKFQFSYLTGGTRNREKVVNEFQENNDIRVFLISLKAGGTGINLIEADLVFLVDPWWNPAVENQAIDRVHRIGQNKKIVAARLICPRTVEEKILQLQASKKELISELITTEEGFLKALSKEELLQLLG
jgi:SNF2 family DNA or RNA helicase